MVNNNVSKGGFYILLSLFFAILLMFMPLPETMRFLRPEWVVMTLIYWAMALPHRVGVGYAWCVGFLMDIMMGGDLGVLAFAYALVVYLVLRFHLQLRQYPVWQQALSIMSLVLLVSIISVVFTPKTAMITIWLPAVVSTMLWPLVYMVLRGVRRQFHVS